MKDIKFRAWDGESMVNNWFMVIYRDAQNIGDLELPPYCQGSLNMTNPLAVMQYTGLKDKNGVEIYEGDIVECYGEVNGTEHKELQIVRYWCGNPCLCFPNTESGIPIFPFNVTHKLYVIGNIYQNHELLTEK